MEIKIVDEEGLKSSGGEADAITVTNLNNNQKPPDISPSISSIVAVSTSESVIDTVEMSSGSNGEEEEDFDWVAVDKESDFITDKAPELDEVDVAFSALQLMFNDDVEEEEEEEQVSESEFVDWMDPPLHLCNTRLLPPYMLDRLYDAFHVFQTDPSVQRMVMSLASDKAVWEAVMNNEVLKELINNAERSEEDSSSTSNCIIRRLFERSAIKIIDAMERVTKYVTDLFNVVPGDEPGVVLASGAAPVMEKLQMTVLLTVVVLLIVLVTRVTGGR